MKNSRRTIAGVFGVKPNKEVSPFTYFALPVCAGVGYYLGARLAALLAFQPRVKVIWPPNSIVLAILLLCPMRRWWLVMLMTAPAHLLAEMGRGVPSMLSLGWFVEDFCEALLGATLIRYLIDQRQPFERFRDSVIVMIFGGVSSILLFSFFGAGLVVYYHWTDEPYWQAWHLRLFSNVLAFVTIVPAITARSKNGNGPAKIAQNHAPEAGLLALGLVCGFFFMFNSPPLSGGFPLALYGLLPFFFWAAIRFGVRGVSVTLLSAILLVAWGNGHGDGPFNCPTPEANALAIQSFFILLAVTLVPLAAALNERNTVFEISRGGEQRYREVVDSQGHLVYRCLADTTLTFVNESCTRFFARSREELIGRRILDLVIPEVHKSMMLNFASAILSRQSIKWQSEAWLPDHGLDWQEWIVQPIIGTDGHVKELQAIGRAITARERTEEALRESEKRYRAVVESQTELVCRYKKDTTLTFVNESFCRFFGQNRGQLIGSAVVDLLPIEAREKMLKGVAAALSSLRSSVWEHAFKMPNETIRWQQWINHPILDALGRVAEIQTIGRDITDRKRVEEAMRNLAHASRLATIGELTAMIAHEVSQPLNAMLNNIEAAQALLRLKTLPVSELHEILNDIRADDLRAGDVVSRVRALAQKRDMEMKPLHINTVIDFVLRLVSSDAFQRHVTIRTTMAADLPTVHGDSAYLQQAILNLVVNGMDALSENPEGERLLTITTGMHAGEEVLVSVRDNGPGIKQGAAVRIFESFFSTKPEGIGLGLSLARSIVSAHGGRIWLENNADRGVTFRFTLRKFTPSEGSNPRPQFLKQA